MQVYRTRLRKARSQVGPSGEELAEKEVKSGSENSDSTRQPSTNSNSEADEEPATPSLPGMTNARLADFMSVTVVTQGVNKRVLRGIINEKMPPVALLELQDASHDSLVSGSQHCPSVPAFEAPKVQFQTVTRLQSRQCTCQSSET